MTPRLVKFVIDMQTQEQKEDETKYISFKNNGGKKWFDIAKLAKVTIPIKKDN